jgi:lysophospholipase L1-like esterase
LFDGLDVTHVRVDITPPLMILPPKEVHPNEKGHEAIAGAILAALRRDAVAKP